MTHASTSPRHQLAMLILKNKTAKKRRLARKAGHQHIVPVSKAPQPLPPCDPATAKALDKYYTRDDVAKFCVQVMKAVTPKGGYYVEPSAGGGAFLNTGLIDIQGFDLLPEDGRITQADFLETELSDHLTLGQMADLRIIGNPPFGFKQGLVVKFLNKSLAQSKYVGFIVGTGFSTFYHHRRLVAGARLVVDIQLPDRTFIHNGKPYRTAKNNGLASRFQIWTIGDVNNVITGIWQATDEKPKLRMHDAAKDMRCVIPHQSTHEDFVSFRRYPDEAPAFYTLAVPVGLVKSKNVIEFANRDELNPNFQYYFMTANDETAANVLKRLDYQKMTEKQLDMFKRLAQYKIVANYIEARAAANDLEPIVDVAQNDNAPLRVVDLFSGMGGMSLGFEKAGFEVVAAFDAWDKALDVYRSNFNHDAARCDLSDHISASKIVASYAPDVIVGGPPCQDYSAAGNQTLGAKADLTVSFAKIVADVRPRYFVMENVPRARRSKTYEDARAILRQAGYGLTEQVLDASLCGVPQKRKRLFIVGKLNAEDGWLDAQLTDGFATVPMSIREYLGDEFGVEHYYVHPRFYYRKAVFSVDRPAPTVRGTNRITVPPMMVNAPANDAPVATVSGLTPEQRARVQSFPVSFKLTGTRTDKDNMVGNAVPPALARYVAEAIAASDGGKRARRGAEAALATG